MLLMNGKTNLILTWSKNSVISNAAENEDITFSITDTNFYVPFLTLSTQYNAKLLEELKPGFKCTINWNQYQ